MKTSKRQTESNPTPDLATAAAVFQGGVETISQIAERLKQNPSPMIFGDTTRLGQGGLPFRVFFFGYHAGRMRTNNPNDRTRILYASKFRGDKQARAVIVEEMSWLAESLCFDVITYAPRRDSKSNHAQLLALGIGRNVDRPVISPTRLAKSNLGDYRILIVDDVFTTGKTLYRLWLKLLPQAPGYIEALVYLKSRRRRRNFF